MTATPLARTRAALQAFTRRRPSLERCDLCAGALAPDHDHLLDPTSSRLRCACQVCARLLGSGPATRWALVRRRVERLADFRLSDEAWSSLGVPVGLAFLVHRSLDGRVVALYPSPGGPVEAAVAPAAWDEVVAANPALAGLSPDVEALLVHRVGGRRDHYRVSIDACYRLVAILRRHWRGFTGGDEVPRRIAEFFAELEGGRA